MSQYNINQNPRNFNYNTIYTQIAPNSSLNFLEVNNLEVSGTIYSATGPVVVDDDLTVTGNIDVLDENVAALLVTNNLTVENELITPLGSVDPLLDALELQAGYGQTYATGATIQANMQPFFDSFMSGEGKGACILGGNIHTNQTYFCSTGVRNSAGQPWTEDTFVYHASASKLYTGLVCTKMIEEGLLNPFDTCGTYWPVMNGTGYYYTDITVSNPVTFPYDPTSYTPTIDTFEWADVTITDLLHFNIGLVSDLYCLPPSNLLFQNPEAIQAVIETNLVAPNPAGLAALLQFIFTFTQSLSGTPVGVGSYITLGSQTPAPNSVVGEYMIEANKANVVPLAFKPGTFANGYLPAGARVYPAQYDIGYLYLGVVLDRVLRAKGWTNGFAQYLRTKFLTPMGCTSTKVFNQESFTAGEIANSLEASWRRAPSLGLTQVLNPLDPSTWPGFGCDNDYRIDAGFSIEGPHVWRSQYPLNSFSVASNVANFQTGSAASYPIGNGPVFASIKDFAKFLQLLCNKGVYNGIRYITPESWAYMTSTKISALSSTQAGPYPTEYGGEWPSEDFCMGFAKIPRDFNYMSSYGVSDEGSFYWQGFGGTTYLFDTYTGNWFVASQTQTGLSTGISGIFPPYPVYFSNENRELAIQALTRN